MTAPAEVTAKLERVRRWLRESGAEAILLASQGWFAWITAGADSHVSLGGPAGAAWVLITETRAYLVAANNELPRFHDEILAGLPFEPISWPWHAKDGGAQAVARLCAPHRALSDLAVGGLAQAPADLAGLRFTLAPGGLTGYGGREIFATPGAPLRLEAGQVLAWNPSIRRVKSEDTVLVTQDAPEVLTLTSRWPREPAPLPFGAIDRPAIFVR